MTRPSAAVSLAIVLSLAGCASEVLPYALQTVRPSLETEPMTGSGDRADDPALWLHPTAVEHSLILGTNKEEGLYVYGLDGKEHERLLVGRVNNVDVRGNVAVASNDEMNALSWFRVDPERTPAAVTHLGDSPVQTIEPYGVCLGDQGGTLTAAVTYKTGLVELWRANVGAIGAPTAELFRTVQLGSQLEGCVFDDTESRLFIGEEEYGIWSLSLDDPSSTPDEIDTIAAGNGLVADVEGLSLYAKPDGTGFLVASAQEADRFVIYDRQPPHAVQGGFRVVESEDGTIDAVTHTDGLDVSSAPLPGYPNGLLIVQDDGNPRSGVDQNFKVIDWRRVEAALQ